MFRNEASAMYDICTIGMVGSALKRLVLNPISHAAAIGKQMVVGDARTMMKRSPGRQG